MDIRILKGFHGRVMTAGWALLWPKGTSALARIRFALRPDGRLEVVEVHIEGRPQLTPRDYLMLPTTTEAEAWANASGPWGGREDLLAAIEAGTDAVEKATDKWLRVLGGGSATQTRPTSTCASRVPGHSS